MSLKVEILTEDKQLAHVCSLYWQIDGDGKFIHTVSEVAEEASLNKRDISKVLAEYAKASSTELACQHCGEPYIFTKIAQNAPSACGGDE